MGRGCWSFGCLWPAQAWDWEQDVPQPETEWAGQRARSHSPWALTVKAPGGGRGPGETGDTGGRAGTQARDLLSCAPTRPQLESGCPGEGRGQGTAEHQDFGEARLLSFPIVRKLRAREPGESSAPGWSGGPAGRAPRSLSRAQKPSWCLRVWFLGLSFSPRPPRPHPVAGGGTGTAPLQCASLYK